MGFVGGRGILLNREGFGLVVGRQVFVEVGPRRRLFVGIEILISQISKACGNQGDPPAKSEDRQALPPQPLPASGTKKPP